MHNFFKLSHINNGDIMKEINAYFKGYNGSQDKLDYLKYGLFNDRGLNLGSINEYNEEEIIKKKCNHESRKKNS